MNTQPMFPSPDCAKRFVITWLLVGGQLSGLPASHATVHVSRRDGRSVIYGLDAVTDAERGFALKLAVDAMSAGDWITLGSGIFDYTAYGSLQIDEDDVIFEGQDADTTLRITPTDHVAIALYADRTMLRDFTLSSTRGGIGYHTGLPSYPPGHAAQGFMIDNLAITGSKDLLMFFPSNTAVRGRVQSTQFVKTAGSDTDLLLDLHLTADGRLTFRDCYMEGENDGTLLMSGDRGARLTLRESELVSRNDSPVLINDGFGDIYLWNVTYDAGAVVGEITQVGYGSPANIKAPYKSASSADSMRNRAICEQQIDCPFVDLNRAVIVPEPTTALPWLLIVLLLRHSRLRLAITS